MLTRRLGPTPWQVPAICMGTSALGSFPAQYGYEVDEATAVAALLEAIDQGLTFIDTSNEYGGGASEVRVGRALAELGGVPPGVLVATKVDPLPGSVDFTGRRVRESVKESRARLGMDRLPLVYLHDPEKIGFDAAMAGDGPVSALLELREQGVIESLGVAGGPIDMELQFLRTGLFDVVLSHNRFTLIDSSAEPLIAECAERGVGFVNAAPFGGGMLVKGPDVEPRYCYAPVAPHVVDRAREMERLCREHDVPLAAAALQFSTSDQRVASTVVGMSRPQRVAEMKALLEHPIPVELWDSLRHLVERGRDGVVP